MLNVSANKTNSGSLAPRLNAFKTLHTPRRARVLAMWLLGILLILFVCLFLPWQQNITAYGKVTALDPRDRPQTIETTIAGRIVNWNVMEGQFVSSGDTIMTLAEIKDDYFDPNLLKRLQEQVQAKNDGIAATQNQISATDRQLVALKNALRFSLQKARNKYRQAVFKLVSDSTDFNAQQLQFSIAQKQFARFEQLHGQNGLISLTDLEQRRLKLQDASAKLISTQNKFFATKNELINARIELSSIDAEYRDKISKAETELSAKYAYLADAESELSKLRNKYANVEVRREQYAIRAPQDGYIVRALKAGIGETIKEGEAVVTIMPDIPKKAVELFVNDMDVPLLSRGRKVRIEFDGWPALQFSGWPSVAVGTFGGEIAVIDNVNSTDGKYRILIIPDKHEEAWPMQLRVGSGAYGWAMLDEVPIWYELWRQLNGFPPSLKKEPKPNDSKTDKEKEGKIKK